MEKIYELRRDDIPLLTEILRETGAFKPIEIDVAVELMEDRLDGGEGSEYFFILALEEGRPIGYVCYGPITMAEGRFDIYWIAVRPGLQGKGIGKALMAEAERLIAASGGKLVFIDTSSKANYAGTRRFYASCGYHESARVKDYFADGDDKVIYSKRL